ncbi:hypothetical protein MICRO116_500015 [Micrococcus sp. 116]|nr:hypothetical protein MICRO116_500015 [Micrococcus sp. 116]
MASWAFARSASASCAALRFEYVLMIAVTPRAVAAVNPTPTAKAFGIAFNAADFSMLSMSISTPPASFALTTMSWYAPRFPMCHSYPERTGKAPSTALGRVAQGV